MWLATSSHLGQILAPTPVECDDVRTHLAPTCCRDSHLLPQAPSINLTSLFVQAYGPKTGCPLPEVTMPCGTVDAEFAKVQCCSQTYADVPGWFPDRLPSPEDCLKDTKLIRDAVVTRLPDAVGRTFSARNFAWSTMLHAKNQRFLLTNEALQVHPEGVYKDCKKFAVCEGGECPDDYQWSCWGADNEYKMLHGDSYKVTNMNDFTQTTVHLKITSINCKAFGCCDADDVPQCMFLKSPYKSTLPLYAFRVYKEYLYATVTWTRYENFGGKYANMAAGDSVQFDPDLFPWKDQESYIVRFKTVDIVNAVDGAHLTPEIVHQDTNPQTTGWGSTMQIEDDVLYTGTSLVHPSKRVMSFDLRSKEVYHYPEHRQIRMPHMVVKNGKILHSSIQRGALQGNFTGQYNAPYPNPEETGFFVHGKDGKYDTTSAIPGGLQNEKRLYGDFVVELQTGAIIYGIPKFNLILSETFGEPIPQLTDFVTQVHEKAGRNTGALEMYDGPTTRFQDEEFLDSQYLSSPKISTMSIDADQMLDVIYTDGMHLKMSLKAPDACKDTKELYNPIIAYLGGYRVTQAGQEWFSKQSNQAWTGLQAGDYLTDAFRADHADELEAWVAQSLLDKYTSPTKSVTCASIYEMEALEVSHSFTIGHVLSDKELATLPPRVQFYLKSYPLPLFERNGVVTPQVEFLTSVAAFGGPQAFLGSTVLPKVTLNIAFKTIYKVGDTYVTTMPQQTPYESFTSL